MKKILLTCFLALPCLFQKARIKLKAKKEHLGFPSPSTASRCDVLIKYLAVGVSHVAKRSVFRAAYLQNKLVLTSPLCLTLTLLCCTSPTLSKSAQSPPESPLHRSAVQVSPHSGDTHRGEETLSDTFTQVDYGAEVSSPANYTTSLTTLDGGPTLRSLVLSTLPTKVGKFEASDNCAERSRSIQHRTALLPPVSGRPPSTKETASLRAFTCSDARLHRTLVLSGAEVSVIGHPTSLPSPVSGVPSQINFGLINPDQDMGAGEGTSSFQPAPVPVLSDGQFNSGREAQSQSTEAQSLVSNVLTLVSKKSSSVPVFKDHDNSGREAYSRSAEAQSLGSNILNLTSSSNLASPALSEVKLPETQHQTISKASDSLTIGDQLPAGIEVNSIRNPTGEAIKLDDFRGKYLLLIFWSPSCSGSIGALPKLEQLAISYKDQLEILPVTVSPEEQVLRVAEVYPSVEKLNLPMGTKADYLRSLFPHSTIPHVVVINPEGKVEAITGVEDITPQNLTGLLKQGSADFRLKVDKKILLDPDQKLISENTHLKNKNIWLQSALTGYLPNVGGSLIQSFEGFSHIRMVNMTPVYMFQLAYSERDLVDYFGVNRIEIIGFDPEELFTEKVGADFHEWAEEGNHVFSYELIAPPSYDPYQLMREDLKRFFPHIEASVQLQKRKVLALVQQGGKEFPSSATENRTYQATPRGVNMTHYPLQGFVYHLNAAFWMARPTPIVNRTGIDYPIDLQLNAPLGNYEKLRAALQEAGLDLIEREEEINILVLKKIAPFKTLTP